MISVLKSFIREGIPVEQDLILNNFATQHLADLLGLPSPGEKKQEMADIDQLTVTVQFHLGGPGGGDFYLISDRGEGTRHDGIAGNPNCTIRVSVDDWKAIQSGEPSRLDALSTGRLVTEGDLGLMGLLEGMMAEMTQV